MSDVKITLKNYRGFSDQHPLQFIVRDGFTAVIGANNAGKSSVLKAIRDFRPMFKVLEAVERMIQVVQNPASVQFKELESSAASGFFHRGNDRPLSMELEVLAEAKPGAAFVRRLLYSQSRNGEKNYSLPGLNEAAQPGVHLSAKLANLGVETETITEAFKSLSRTIFIPAHRNILHQINSMSGPVGDIKLGKPFIDQWRKHQGSDDFAERETIISITKQIRDIFGYDSLGIQTGDSRLFVDIDGKAYDLEEQGIGLSQFIHAIASAAFDKPDFILIDEPETSLHPSLQLKFLEALGSHAKRGVIFATHSVGLARSSAEYIYSIHRDGDARILARLESSKSLAELLGELSYSSHRELGFQKVLLVEGPTEVKTIQQILRKLGKDHEVLLLPLGGRSMICGGREAELAEIERISPNVHALIDSERHHEEAAIEEPIPAFQEMCKNAGIRCLATKLRATENYFTERAIQKVKGPKYKALGPYEKLSSQVSPWSKLENWQIASEMTREEWLSTDIGKFIYDM